MTLRRGMVAPRCEPILFLPMRMRHRPNAERLGAWVQRLLARGWLPRLVACCVVAAAAIVWLGVALAVLRLVVFTAAVLAFAWCGWLVATVWRNAPPGTDSPPWAPDRVWARLRRLGDRSDEPRRDDEAATVAAVRASADALDTIFDELEADLRLESIEERERTLSERERRLERREKDLAAFVAQTQ